MTNPGRLGLWSISSSLMHFSDAGVIGDELRTMRSTIAEGHAVVGTAATPGSQNES